MFKYKDLLTLANISRDPIVLALAEIHHRWFKALVKSDPVTLSNAAFLACGLTHKTKKRALGLLEQAGMIRVVEREKKSPLIYVLFKSPTAPQP